ncbi:carbon-nitrogen hydrolase family protein [Labrys okinawensis]|uniref:Carbon-nitrogen hydrolase family protein n=1 Tax=Labrys okinawensis TaxID=346911 RepID=A0A2S9QGG7_9HYPH|nr:carbon-nitrogen hydrolase family protein [Labrys okinawensis]PRH88461.1 carbon-nitrogen hydrolase family protein [Labrys okinawensis]
MTQNGNFKRRVRARAPKTGESYTAALRHIRQASGHDTSPNHTDTQSLRLAVAQTSLFSDPRDGTALRSSGVEIRRLMREADKEGARLIHFPEGATCSPNKRIMSQSGPENIGPSDWTRFDWAVLGEELEEIGRLARELGLWAVFGSVHRLTPPHRPHNSLYVVSDRGELVTRYDERMLSNTKISFMYSPGKGPVTFEVEHLRFGCALGMEAHYPEIFTEYERLDVDCVLFSTTGEIPSAAPPFAAEALGHAASNTYWVSYAAHAPQSVAIPAGIAAPDGRWKAQCPADGAPALIVTDISVDRKHPARPWRRTARSDLYEAQKIDGDPRSDARNSF